MVFSPLLLSQVWIPCLWIPPGLRVVRANSARGAAVSACGAARGSGGSPRPCASRPPFLGSAAPGRLPLLADPASRLPGSPVSAQRKCIVLLFRQAGENVWRVLHLPGFETADFVRIACPDIKQLYLNYPYPKYLKSKKKKKVPATVQRMSEP